MLKAEFFEKDCTSAHEGIEEGKEHVHYRLEAKMPDGCILWNGVLLLGKGNFEHRQTAKRLLKAWLAEQT